MSTSVIADPHSCLHQQHANPEACATGWGPAGVLQQNHGYITDKLTPRHAPQDGAQLELFHSLMSPSRIS